MTQIVLTWHTADVGIAGHAGRARALGPVILGGADRALLAGVAGARIHAAPILAFSGRRAVGVGLATDVDRLGYSLQSAINSGQKKPT